MKAIERLFQYIDFKKVNKSELERKTGISNGYLAKQLARKADMGESILNNILENCPEINPIWLLTGEGNMLKEESPPDNRVKSVDNDILCRYEALAIESGRQLEKIELLKRDLEECRKLLADMTEKKEDTDEDEGDIIDTIHKLRKDDDLPELPSQALIAASPKEKYSPKNK